MQGFLLIDKPEHFTSFDVVAVLRGLLHTKKIGHTGTLDPMATGVLAIFTGRATKLCELLPSDEKRYTATFQLGMTSDTLDRTGTILSRSPVTATKVEVEQTLVRFIGEIEQIPPMYSAIKQDGVRLYDLARQGKTAKRESRSVTIHELRLLDANEAEHRYTIDVRCSKGTYVRSLCDDIGQALGCGAVVTDLRRTCANGFGIEQCVTLEQLKAHNDPSSLLISCDQALTAYHAVTVTEGQAKRFGNGGALAQNRIKITENPTEYLRVYAPDGAFLGLGVLRDGELKVQCILTEIEYGRSRFIISKRNGHRSRNAGRDPLGASALDRNGCSFEKHSRSARAGADLRQTAQGCSSFDDPATQGSVIVFHGDRPDL